MNMKYWILIGKFQRRKGYAFNWERIIDLIEKGEKNLDIFLKKLLDFQNFNLIFMMLKSTIPNVARITSAINT